MQTYIKENNEYIKINPMRAMYLEYLNNFLSVARFAEHYALTEDEAMVIIQAGRTLQADHDYILESNKAKKLALIAKQEREQLDKINKDYWNNNKVVKPEEHYKIIELSEKDRL